MTTIQVMSDLHIDTREYSPPPLVGEPDILILAGDVCDGYNMVSAVPELLSYLRNGFGDIPILLIPGNHDWYGKDWAESNPFAIYKDAGASVLDKSSLEVFGYRFVGCTLWSDFYGVCDDDQIRAIHESVYDFREISLNNKSIFPADMLNRHTEELEWLNDELSGENNEKTIVVTHFAPAFGSIDVDFLGHFMNPFMMSDQEAVITQTQPHTWIHGHMHKNADYRLGKTRILCNPWGVEKEDRGFKVVEFELPTIKSPSLGGAETYAISAPSGAPSFSLR